MSVALIAQNTEAVVWRCSVKKFSEILKILLQITYTRVSFFFFLFKNLYQMFFCEFCEISNKTFFYRTLLVAAFNVLISFYFPGIIRKIFLRASPPISHQSFPLNPLGDLQHPQTPSCIQVL